MITAKSGRADSLLARFDKELAWLGEADFAYVSTDTGVVDGRHAPGTRATVFEGLFEHMEVGSADHEPMADSHATVPTAKRATERRKALGSND